MSNFTQAFLYAYSFEKEAILVEEEKEFVDFYAKGDSLKISVKRELPKMEEISDEEIDRITKEELHKERRFISLQTTLKYVYLIEKDIRAMAKDGMNVSNTTDLEQHVIGLHCNLTDLFLQDPFENNYPLLYSEHYEIDRQLFGYVHDIKGWQKHKESFEKNAHLKKWSEAAGLSELFDRMILSYLEDLLSHIKLMLALMIMRIAPVYSDTLSKMAGELLEIFRRILYDKRVRKILLDPKDMEKCDKIGSKATTKIEIFFSLSNGDNYCLRLDYGHEDHEYVHLNLNEPGRSHGDIAFPIGVHDKEAIDVQQACGANLSDFFLVRDDCYWFKSGFKTRIVKNNLPDKNKRILENIYKNRTHYKLDDSVWSQGSAEEFSKEFEEICTGLRMFDDKPFEKLGKKEAIHFSHMKCVDDLLAIVNEGMGVAFREAGPDDDIKEFGSEINHELLKLIPNDESIKEEKEELISTVDDLLFDEFIEYAYSLVSKSI